MARTLHAGPLSLRYENGEIRTLKLGDTELIRRIYAAVRDRNWGTIPIAITDEHISDGGDHFQIEFRACHQQNEIAFEWHGQITGRPDGSVSFVFDGEAKSNFERNRIGFSVLHPLRECVGRAVRLEHVDGTDAQSCFPIHIAPHCPFQNLALMSHQVDSNLWATVRFEGDVFETEDQRNWMDASFKTYCTPLERPFPVHIQAGTRIFQRLTLHFEGQWPDVAPTPKKPLRLEIGDTPCGRMPPLGLGMATDEPTINSEEIERLKSLNLSHLRVDLRLEAADFAIELLRANTEATALGCALEIGVFTGDSPDFTLLQKVFRQLQAPIKSLLLFRDNLRPVSAEVFQLAREFFPHLPIGTGSNANFAEFNRNPPPPADFVVFSANPQVHAFDDISLLETPESLGHLVASARHKMLSQGVAISPLTLKPRFNAVATEPARPLRPHELPPNVDERQTNLLGAVWTFAAIAALSVSGLGTSQLDSLTLFETTGWRGIMVSDLASNGQLHSQTFPIWHLLHALVPFAKQEVYTLTPNEKVTGLACHEGSKSRVLLANLTNEIQPVELALPVSLVRVRNLEQQNSELGWSKPENLSLIKGMLPLHLAAYSVLSIDFPD